jgi:ABC-type glycerol-3-phosphate transport system substrate-binding protein/ABC-type branched-subunit amino acid transport system substrate-binding protein
MIKSMKSFTMLLLILILSGTMTNCTSRVSGAGTTITIAVIENDFGTSSNPKPQSIYAGAKLAADQMNARGYDVRLVPYADQDDLGTARQIAAQIADSAALAVIGHSTIETSAAAADVYDAKHIPAVGVIAANADLAESHDYYFNLSYTAEMQAAYLANYLRKIQAQPTASIISTDSIYSKTLAEKFRNTFTGLGGQITFDAKVSQNAGDSELEQIASSLVTADTTTNNPGAIFIVTDDATTARLIVKMSEKGLDYPISGADNVDNPDFIALMSSNSEEKIQAGALTDGILTTSSVIFDSANRFAYQFLLDYHKEYPQTDSAGSINNSYYRGDPGNKVANGYDAALAIVTAALKANLGENTIQSNREQIYQSLLQMDSPTTAAQGIVGPLYFDPSRNAIGTAHFGVYQNGELISAMTQFEPISSSQLPKPADLKDQIASGRIATVNGKYVYVANVVYAGVDMIDIHDLDIKTSTYVMDFYLWFRYRAHLEDTEFKPASFAFTNAVSVEDGANTPIREPETVDGITTETYRVTGTFKNPFYFYDYPFDRQALSLQFRNTDATTTYIQYVVDRIGMQYRNESALAKHFENNGAFNSLSGWKVTDAIAQESVFSTTSTLGNPQNFGRNTSTDFSLINVSVEVRRNSLQFIIKSLLPLLFTLILAYITFFLPLGHSERLGVGSSALLATAFFHLALADSLAQIGYTVAMEYLFYASYLMSAAIVFLETISIRIEKRSEDEKDEAVKQDLQKKRENLNRIGRIIYPSIFAVVLVGGLLVALGTIQLNPNSELESQNLVARLPEQQVQTQAISTPTKELTKASSGQVVLTLETWRPEDTENMKQLLAEFHNYAMTKDKDIVLEYQSAIGSNYDALLNAQLDKGQAPDLFYVRPHAVDGDLARYLVDISSLGIGEKFDENESHAWQNNADGKYYAMPYVGVVQGVYYNKDFFDKYNLEVPTTWAKFIRLAEFIQKQGKNPIANALNERQDSEMFQSILASFIGGSDGRAHFERTNGTSYCFTNYRMVSAFQAMEEMRPFLLSDAGTMDDTKGKQSFIKQESIMLFGGSWDMEMFSRDAKFNWSVFAPPAPEGKQTYIIFEPDTGIGINRSSKHKEEARLFLEWLMTDGAKASEKYLPGRYPLINEQGSTSNVAATGHDADFARLTTSYPSDIRWMAAEVDSQYPRASEIVRQTLHDMITVQYGISDSGEVTQSYLSAWDAAQRLQSGLGEWYTPAQMCR